MKILYVEDEKFLAQIVREGLERNGHEVLHLGHGRNLMEEFRDFKPEICVLDIMLPHKNGYELAQEIRKVDSQIPLLFLTAKSQTEDVVTGFKSGGNDYIKKPFSLEELLVRLDNLLHMTQLRHEQLEIQEEYELGSIFRFIPVKQQLICKDETRLLSHKETLILQILCMNRNTASKRKEILMKVWGDDSYFNSRNLDVYIRKLRKYFSEDPKIKIITLKGVGYNFIVES